MASMKKLYEMLEDRVDSAKHFAKCAMHEKCCYPIMAKTFYDISVYDMNSAKKLQEEIEALIKSTDENEESAQMMAVFDYMTDRMIEKMARVREYQSLYREG